MIETVWPSAARALELLRGAKVNLQDSDFMSQSQASTRPKRSAAQPLDDSDQLNGRFFNGPADNVPSTRPNGLGTNYIYPTTTVFVPHTPLSSHQSNASAISPMSAPSPTNYRWHSEDFHTHHSFSNNAPLSTSVLPQLYSTGFGDDRGHVPSSRHQPHDDQNSQVQPTRYPQYWNDYSTFPQLAPTYGSIQEPPHASHSAISPQMYIHEQYNIYSK